MHAETATGAGDQHPVSRRNAAHSADSVQNRADGTGRDGSRIECDLIGHGHDVVRIHCDVLGISAI